MTQNGRVVRDYVTNADTGAFVRCLDFFYDQSGRPFAMRSYYDSTLTGYDTFHYVLNAQGDVLQLNYQGGTVYAQYTYDAWGNVLTKSGSLADVNPLRYRGYYCDTETGFYYLQSRYYDPIVKRFLNADSYGSTGQGILGYNMFAYCGNNPVSRSDPSGHIWINWITKVREMVQIAKKAAARTKKEFEERFESACNKSLESCKLRECEWLSVSAKTVRPNNIWGDISKGATYGGGALTIISYFIPGVNTLTALSSVVSLIGLYGQIENDLDVEPHVQYVKYTIDCGGSYDWRRDPVTGEWSGKAVGEKHTFYWYQINSENGIKTVMEYKGGTTYYTTPASKGIYMYDFDFNQPLIYPFP